MTHTVHRPIAVITGAARGIGAAVAGTLAREGWDLVLGDSCNPDLMPELGYALASERELVEVADSCRSVGANVTTMCCDVRNQDQMCRLVELAGPNLRAAVAVAGVIATHGLAWEQTHEDFSNDLDVNLHGIVNLARAAVPVLLKSENPPLGRFVAVASSAAERGLPRLASYVAAKHAALGFIRALACDLGQFGITANAVLPGSTDTALLARTAHAYDLDSPQDFSQNQRLGRLLRPEEIAAAVAWLCSAAASGTTGLAMNVDGGFTG
ncbi:MAG TPA: SDR family mycofactocin-dependent oxidoreductase [Actinobacteria bacterium]|nr:SDR family mycofactocin-dependent oxidoreductase [Actinomycetota bacterium]